MADESQLIALQKACEAQEQEIARRKKEIAKVRHERQEIVDELERTRKDLESKVSSLLGKDRLKASRGTRGPDIQGVTNYAERVREEVEKTKMLLDEKRKDLDMALAREKLIEDELMSARLETRKVERLLDERNLQTLVHTTALEEVSTDELSSTIMKRSSE